MRADNGNRMRAGVTEATSRSQLYLVVDASGDALARVSDLAGQLVGAERWDPELAEQVLQDLEACGPAQLVRLGDSR